MGLYLSGNYREELARQSLAASLSPEAIDALWPATAGGGHPEASLAAPLARAATLLAQAIPHFPAPFTLPSEESNEWAVDGAHSATGAPLLAGDPASRVLAAGHLVSRAHRVARPRSRGCHRPRGAVPGAGP